MNLLLDGGFPIICPETRQVHPDFDALRFANAVEEINTNHMLQGQSVYRVWFTLLSGGAEDEVVE